ncbi:hypothetical protein CRG98_011313 [Punica granatum]|uniref:Uncharacterized protein n=1 Tax=Punica granatum TaxID=22663 RepID=A0A2I0KJB1_PUNGR|nr:hypothetical protein CRG98_011313 [Punica granatum]
MATTPTVGVVNDLPDRQQPQLRGRKAASEKEGRWPAVGASTPAPDPPIGVVGDLCCGEPHGTIMYR